VEFVAVFANRGKQENNMRLYWLWCQEVWDRLFCVCVCLWHSFTHSLSRSGIV